MPLRWDDDASPYDDLPWSAHNAETGVLSVNNRTSRNAGRTEIAPGTHLIPDYGTLFDGYIKFHPKFAAKMLPVHEGKPDQPNDADFKPGIQLQLLIQNIGMTFFTTTSTFNINAINRYIGVFRRAPQAIAGQLPIYKLLPGEAIAWGDGTFYPIVLEQVGWTERDESIFGARIVPPPRGRGTSTAVVGFTPPTLLPGAAEPLPAAPSVLPDAVTPAPVAPPVAAAAVPVTGPAPAVATAPTPPAAQDAGAPFDGPYTVSPPVATAAAAASPTPPPAAAPVADPFAIFRRGNNPVPQPIPQPRSAA